MMMNSFLKSRVGRFSLALACLLLPLRVSAQSMDNPHHMAMPETPQTQSAPTGVSDAEARQVIVARVNQASITLFTVRGFYKRSKGDSHGEQAGASDTGIQAALDRAIFEEMVYQKGVAEGSLPPAAEIDSRVQALKKKIGDEAFAKGLADQNFTEQEWRDAYVRRLVIDHTLAGRISDVQVSDEDIAAEYEKQKAAFYRREKVEVTDIVFFLDQKDPASAAAAEKMLAKLRDGEDSDPYHLKPDGSFIVHDMEVTAPKNPELYIEAKKLQVGQYSGVIHAADALHILRLKEFVTEKQFTVQEVKPLLVNQLKTEAQKRKIQEFESELKKEYKIEIIDMNTWKDKL